MEPLRRAGAAVIALTLAGGSASAEFYTLKGHGGPVMAIAADGGGRVLTASFDNSVGLWTDRSPLWLEGHAAAVTAVAFVGDGTALSAGDDFALRRWSLATGEGGEIGRHGGKIASIAVYGLRAATASWDGEIGIWNLDTGRAALLRGHGGPVNSVVFDGPGRLISASADGTVRAWDAASGRETQRLVEHGFGVNTLALGPGWLAYGAVDGGTRIVDSRTGAQIADFTLGRRPILAMARAPGRLAVGDGEGYIMIIDTARWRIAKDFRATRRGPVWALAFDDGGERLHAGGLSDSVWSWPVADLSDHGPAAVGERGFLRDPGEMSNGERQFMRKCSICHALTPDGGRKAGPTLHAVFGRPAGAVAGYPYSETLGASDIVWSPETLDALFDEGPDHYIPGSKMPMQVIARASDRADLIDFLTHATGETR